MTSAIWCRTAAAAVLLASSLSVHAHRAWLLPSATVLSGDDPWVTVDAAVSNDLFFFEHQPLRLENLQIVGPDGAAIKAENPGTGKYRSTFDVRLTQPGTYRLAVVNDGYFASWKEDGKVKRWRGTLEKFAAEVPAKAVDLQVTQAQGRVESFITRGKPNATALKLTGRGMELEPVTHPNDLVVGETAQFRLVLDGKPVAGIDVEVVPGGIRYRDKLRDFKVTTDQDGKFAIKWDAPGMYWIEAVMKDSENVMPPAKERRASYVGTLEVLPP